MNFENLEKCLLEIDGRKYWVYLDNPCKKSSLLIKIGNKEYKLNLYLENVEENKEK